ncbi:hypothetical protein X735_15070 [Mesorhizobium sp. L2C085B000]|nr:hypothetical protein X735_15070 [Mesorhizobium sp. L2C085B000]
MGSTNRSIENYQDAQSGQPDTEIFDSQRSASNFRAGEQNLTDNCKGEPSAEKNRGTKRIVQVDAGETRGHFAGGKTR